MMRTARILGLALLLLPSLAQATRYGSLQDVEAVSCSVSVNPEARALGLNPHTVSSFVSARLTAEGVVNSRTSPYRLVVLVDGISLGVMPAENTPAGTHFMVVRMYLVRDRAEGALVLWEDMAYGGWSQRGPGVVIEGVEGWLDNMCRDFVLDYYRDAAVDRGTPTP